MHTGARQWGTVGAHYLDNPCIEHGHNDKLLSPRLAGMDVLTEDGGRGY